MDRIILASASPRRKQLLEWAELDFEIMVQHTSESFPAGMQVEETPVYIAREKALAVRQAVGENRLIVAADTVVVLDEMIIGKPSGEADAFRILSALAGRTHRVITGVVLMRGKKERSFCESTEVCFHPLTATAISHYIEKYKPYDKAGAYAIQEWIGVTGIRWIRGDFYNVMGLPVSKLLQELDAFDN
jgi:septum formation protein